MKKKILFWINSGTMNIFGLAKYLQNDMDAEFFAIYDVTDRPKKFFQEQKLVNFQKIWFYHDFIQKKTNTDLDYLKEFECKYGINLLNLAYSERIFLYNEFYKFSNNEILSILEQESKNFEKILDDIKPDYIIMVTPYFHHDSIFFNLCKSKGITVLDLGLTRFPNRCVISFDKIKEKYDDFKISNKTRTFDELRNYRTKNSSFSKDVHLMSGEFKSSKYDFLSAGLEYFFGENENVRTHYTYQGRSKLKVLLNYLLDKIRIKARKKFIEKYFKMDFTENRKFILFTLQVNAESAVLLDAPFYINQIEVVRNISKSMPADHLLLVKEHPASFVRSWRSVGEYKELRNIPGVVLIHPSANSQELMKKSSLVISICGSSSLDAQFLEKPSIIFADTNFSMIPSIQKVKEIEKLPELIKQTISRRIEPKEIEKYIQFVEKKSFEYNQILHGQEMQKFLYHGGVLVDVSDLPNKMNVFLENTKPRFQQLKNAYLECIQKDL